MTDGRPMFGATMLDVDDARRPFEAQSARGAAMDAALIRETRERAGLPAAEFARRLRVSPRTLERWERGRTRPHPQAAVLILLVRQFPDMLGRLGDLEDRP